MSLFAFDPAAKKSRISILDGVGKHGRVISETSAHSIAQGIRSVADLFVLFVFSGDGGGQVVG